MGDAEKAGRLDEWFEVAAPLEIVSFIRSLVRERDAVETAYQKHIFDLGLTADALDPATLEGEVWFILHPNTEAPQRSRGAPLSNQEQPDAIGRITRWRRGDARYRAADKALRRIAGFLASRRRWRFVSVRRVERELREAVEPLAAVLREDKEGA